MQRLTQFFINGAWVDAIDGRELAVINPANEQECAVISLGGAADTDAAVAAAKAALSSWSETSVEQRVECLESILEEYQRRIEDIAQAISTEMGAPMTLARKSQAAAGAEHIEHTIKALSNFNFHSLVDGERANGLILREPYGVAALITPWNWPMNQVTLKVAPAIAAGCTMVLKPSEIAPLSSYVFAEVIAASRLPAGVFNLVNGDGAGVGSQLSSHPDVDLVSFTGSTRAGKLITKSAADTIKRVSLELGGKGANLVFADADAKAIVRGVRHCFNNSGQSCNAPTRMLVQRAIYDDALEQAYATAARTEVGDPATEGRHIGPVVSQMQYEKIQRLIQIGIDEGARLLTGGVGRADGFERGYFVKPTIFADVTADMTIFREEIFGPVLAIMPFDDEEEAIAIANDTLYGLTNYIQTADEARAHRVARKLRSGMVEINGVSLSEGAPFGGYRQSGNGRERGVWGIEEFLETKAVSATAA